MERERGGEEKNRLLPLRADEKVGPLDHTNQINKIVFEFMRKALATMAK